MLSERPLIHIITPANNEASWASLFCLFFMGAFFGRVGLITFKIVSVVNSDSAYRKGTKCHILSQSPLQ